MGQRIRLDEDERVYLIDLVNENIKLQGALVSLPIRKLLKKLGDDAVQPSKRRKIPVKHFACKEDGCDKVAKSAAGLTRHTTTMHLREPTDKEKQPIHLIKEGLIGVQK